MSYCPTKEELRENETPGTKKFPVSHSFSLYSSTTPPSIFSRALKITQLLFTDPGDAFRGVQLGLTPQSGGTSRFESVPKIRKDSIIKTPWF